MLRTRAVTLIAVSACLALAGCNKTEEGGGGPGQPEQGGVGSTQDAGQGGQESCVAQGSHETLIQEGQTGTVGAANATVTVGQKVSESPLRYTLKIEREGQTSTKDVAEGDNVDLDTSMINVVKVCPGAVVLAGSTA